MFQEKQIQNPDTIKTVAHKNGFLVRHSDVQHMQPLNHGLFRSENDSDTCQHDIFTVSKLVMKLVDELSAFTYVIITVIRIQLYILLV